MTDYSLYARTYDREFGRFVGDVSLYADLARETGDPVLELGAGTGRLALPLARCGHAVTGVDDCPGMLGELRAKLAAEPGLAVTVVEGDLRTFEAPGTGSYRLACLAARTLLHFLTPADQLAVLGNARRHLAPDGLLAGSVFRPSVEALAAHDGRWSPWVWTHDYLDPTTHRIVSVHESSRADLRESLYRTRFREEERTPDGSVVRVRVRDLVVTYVWPRELEHLLWRAGYEVRDLWGDFTGTPAEEGGGELVFVARLR